MQTSTPVRAPIQEPHPTKAKAAAAITRGAPKRAAAAPVYVGNAVGDGVTESVIQTPPSEPVEVPMGVSVPEEGLLVVGVVLP